MKFTPNHRKNICTEEKAKKNLHNKRTVWNRFSFDWTTIPNEPNDCGRLVASLRVGLRIRFEGPVQSLPPFSDTSQLIGICYSTFNPEATFHISLKQKVSKMTVFELLSIGRELDL